MFNGLSKFVTISSKRQAIVGVIPTLKRINRGLECSVDDCSLAFTLGNIG
jgi:hypothetical protein